MLTPATHLLSFAIIFAYASMLVSASSPLEGFLLFEPTTLLNFGAANPKDIWQGQTWRIFTALFVHGGFLHLFFNLFVLRQIGPLLEPTLGTARFLLLFLATGLGSFGFSLYINGQLAVGASGGLFGLIGGLLVLSFFVRRQAIGKRLFVELLVVILINLAIGWLIPIVDNAAHLGGLCIGIVLGAGLLADRPFLFFVEPPKSSDSEGAPPSDAKVQILGTPRLATWGSFFGLALCVALLALGLKPINRVHYHLVQAHDAIDYGNPEKLNRHLNLAQLIDPFHPGVDLLEGRALLQKGDAEKAKPFLVNALRNLNQKPNVAWGVALQSIAPTSKYDQRLFYDARLTNALCDEALALTLTEPVVELINDCAWFLLTTKTPRFHKPSKAIQLARFAVEQAREKPEDRVPPAILHTLAEAEAQTGRPDEAAVMMEKVLLTKSLRQRDYYRKEYERFLKMAQAQGQPMPAKSQPDF